jgi:hypothetical protein
MRFFADAAIPPPDRISSGEEMWANRPVSEVNIAMAIPGCVDFG